MVYVCSMVGSGSYIFVFDSTILVMLWMMEGPERWARLCDRDPHNSVGKTMIDLGFVVVNLLNLALEV